MKPTPLTRTIVCLYNLGLGSVRLVYDLKTDDITLFGKIKKNTTF